MDFSFYWQELACKFCPVMSVPMILRNWSKLVVQMLEYTGSDAEASWSVAKTVDFMALVTRHCFLNLTCSFTGKLDF